MNRPASLDDDNSDLANGAGLCLKFIPGHFKKVVWQKGIGLVEYSAGQGAMADGYRLKRVEQKKR